MICIRRSLDFRGRAPRSEYWYWRLFVFVVDILTRIADVLSGYHAHGFHVGPFSAIFVLLLFLPDVAVSFRRIHDIGRSAWWMLLVFLPIVGWIILLVWTCRRGTVGPNRFGADELA